MNWQPLFPNRDPRGPSDPLTDQLLRRRTIDRSHWAAVQRSVQELCAPGCPGTTSRAQGRTGGIASTTRPNRPLAAMSAKTSLSLLALALLATHAFAQDAIHGRCVGVTDGDTIRVLAPRYQLLQIRLAWIDAPEMGQAFGYRAKQAMSERTIPSRTVQHGPQPTPIATAGPVPRARRMLTGRETSAALGAGNLFARRIRARLLADGEV